MKEELAEICHDQWSGWMEHLFSKCFQETGQFDKETGNLIIPQYFVGRGKRQMKTSYKDLSEKEKDSDRIEADKFLKFFQKEVWEEWKL